MALPPFELTRRLLVFYAAEDAVGPTLEAVSARRSWDLRDALRAAHDYACAYEAVMWIVVQYANAGLLPFEDS